VAQHQPKDRHLGTLPGPRKKDEGFSGLTDMFLSNRLAWFCVAPNGDSAVSWALKGAGEIKSDAPLSCDVGLVNC